MMEPDLTIPKELKRKNPLRLIALMGLAVLSFILVVRAGRVFAETLTLVSGLNG